jgi:ribosome-binding ATPase YchF (GTP1/OBG family)
MEAENVAKLKEMADKENSEVIVVSAKMEEELCELDDDEKELFKEELGITSFGLDKLVVAGYRILGLISYLTAGEQEVRAWTITNGMKAPEAAGKIHTDFEKGFIKAEVVAYDDLVANGSYNVAREKGLVRIEGKDYVVKDGDVMLFRFNV